MLDKIKQVLAEYLDPKSIFIISYRDTSGKRRLLLIHGTIEAVSGLSRGTVLSTCENGDIDKLWIQADVSYKVIFNDKASYFVWNHRFYHIENIIQLLGEFPKLLDYLYLDNIDTVPVLLRMRDSSLTPLFLRNYVNQTLIELLLQCE